MTARVRLRDDLRLDVTYEDQTPFGSALSGGSEKFLRSCCSEISAHREKYGMADVVRESGRLLRTAFSGDLSRAYTRPDTLREECLFPAPDRVLPASLQVTRGGTLIGSIPLSPRRAKELAPFVGELYRGTMKPVSGAGRGLFEALEACGALCNEGRASASVPEADATFVGHATVLVHRVLFDPFLLPRSDGYPARYQPLAPADLGSVEAVFITHSHPDHFDPGSLLCLGHDVPIYVPEVQRESLLSVDMAFRLEELGFCNVRRISPGTEALVGETRVTALPFFGEQPTVGEVYHPAVRNVGCTYLVESRDKRHLIVADSGADRDGDVRSLADDVRRERGAVDLLFSGYRAFAVYPIHYLFSSVARYLLFVPRSEWSVRQKTMNDADALLDTAERAGARHVVPYADGGAPWYWERGLGPRLDGHAIPNPAIDSPPEGVARLAARRSSSREGPIASPVNVLVLRPGETVSLTEGAARVDRGVQQVWPYVDDAWFQANVALTRLDGSALPSALRVFEMLSKVVSELREGGRLSCFFFMRKPPDLRLRFRGESAVGMEVRRCLDELVAEGPVERWFSSVYEPEAERFGGAAAMDAVHEWFDRDTALWMELDQRRARDGYAAAPEGLCGTVAHDLVRRTVDDGAEACGVWRGYVAALSLPRPAETSPGGSPETSAAERELLQGYLSANARLSAELRDLWNRGELTAGLRAVAGAVILFHFHRHGLGPEAHARIAWTMIDRLEAGGS